MKNLFFIFIINLCFFTNSIHAKIFYVDHQATEGVNNGENWKNAFTSLKTALFEAQYGDTIWVAKGVYYPVSSLRNDAFFIKNGIALFGGFSGKETAVEERNVILNNTILSGERGDESIFEDNHFHVVSMTNVDSTTILDGFTITKGYAFDEDALFNHHSLRGGGIFIENNRDNFNSNPVIRNCIFVENIGRFGGACFIKSQDETNQRASPFIDNCQFYKNKAIWTGGAIYKEGGSSNFRILNTSFIENKVDLQHGGAIHFLNSYGKNIIKNCVFEKDSVKGEGGAIFYETRRKDSELNITKCMFKDNFTTTDGGAIELASLEVQRIKTYHNFFIDSCTFENNHSIVGVGGALAISNVFSQFNVNISNTLFHNNYARNGGGSIHSQVNWDSIFLKIDKCIFRKNTSVSGFDGNIYLRTDASPAISYQNLQVTNSLLTNNGGAFSVFSGSHQGKVTSAITNCTLYKNGVAPIIKNWSEDFDGLNRYNNMKMVNSIFYETPNIFFVENNSPSMEEIFFNNNLDSLHLADYKFENCWINATPISNCDSTCGKNLIFGKTPLFSDTSNNDFSLIPCSPLVDAGNSELLQSDFSNDLSGNPRIINDIIDMGAFENESYQTITVEGEQINSSSANSSDGQIIVKHINGGQLPFKYMWSNGDTLETIQNLIPDKYTLTITDSNGCSEEFEFEVSFTSSTFSIEENFSSFIYPNPAQHGITNLTVNSVEPILLQIRIYDSVGKQLSIQSLQLEKGQRNYPLKIPNVKGLYFITLHNITNNRFLNSYQIEVL